MGFDTPSGGGGALEDSGSDNIDGGDAYQLPNTEDGIDLRDGELNIDTAKLTDGSTRLLYQNFGRLNLAGSGSNHQIQTGALQAKAGSGGFQADGGTGCEWTTNPQELDPQDVRNISSPSQGWFAYHDGSGSNTEGLAAYNGTDWISQVDGSTVS